MHYSYVSLTDDIEDVIRQVNHKHHFEINNPFFLDLLECLVRGYRINYLLF